MTTTGGRHTSRRSSERLAIKSLSRFKNTSKSPIIVDCDDTFEMTTEGEEEDNITLKEKGNLKRKKLKHEDGGVKPKKKDSKRQREDNSSNTKLWYPIKNRCSPTQLAKVVKTLSTKQKDLIEKLGFGKLLSFQVDGIPQKLGHFVVDKFDAVKMEISLKGGVVRINVDTINWLLGIPKTCADLKTFTPRKKLSPRIQQWRDLYKSEYVSPREISYRMAMDTSDESFHFQLDFLLLFISTIVECHAHGKCKLEILDYFNDHTDISQINWSAYVLDSIKNCKNGWKPFSNTRFKGALTILTLFYVASFSCEDMSVDHSIPPIEFWTLDRLHQRQTLEIASGGFGRGKFIRLSSVDGETSNINNEEECSKMDLVAQISDVSQMLEMTSENKKLLKIKLEGLLKNNHDNEQIQALAATFENIFKEKVNIEKAHDSTELGINNNSVSGVGPSRSWKKDTIDERIFDICLEVNARRQPFIDSETDEEEAPEDEIRLEDKNQGLGGKDDLLEAEPQDKMGLEDQNHGSQGKDQLLEKSHQILKEESKLKPGNMLIPLPLNSSRLKQYLGYINTSNHRGPGLEAELHHHGRPRPSLGRMTLFGRMAKGSFDHHHPPDIRQLAHSPAIPFEQNPS
ncbi:hypothetical protein E3N88_44397 [Mikania micrantha]|uniref:Aminotransferase-like plant mobile domain-containing protein n=1 Tax=Mikania micrantha TaxID=192012 RepID=A0A5N6LC68_9ASTR|nr:hypothetical protein E3N88_44397 [Mikania micrantha]